MPATITLSTIPGCIELCDSYNGKTLDLFGPSLGREAVEVATVADIRTAVQAFGARVRAVHPDSSFQVSISVRKDDRKPNNFDKAHSGNGFGQEDFLRTVDRRAKQPARPADADAVPAASTTA